MALYFIAIEPQPDLGNRIKLIQKDFAERFQSVKSFKHFPHITIIPPFNYDDAREPQLLNVFQNIEISTSKFQIELENFGCFDHQKAPVIFIKPKDNLNLISLYLKFQSIDLFKTQQDFHPHITLAFSDLTYIQFQNAWVEYQNISFKDSFCVDSIRLYKHNGKEWQLIAEKKLLPTGCRE